MQHLGTDYLDSYLLHGPSMGWGLTDLDWEVWRSMEEIHRCGKAKHIGVSNVNLEQLVELCEDAQVKPAFVQNRCFAETHWDQEVRKFCKEHEISYQGFSLLTANRQFLGGEIEHPKGRNIPCLVFRKKPENTEDENLHPKFRKILQEMGRSPDQVIFRFAQQVGMIPITGTRSEEHMRLDLAIRNFTLSSDQIHTVENLAFLS